MLEMIKSDDTRRFLVKQGENNIVARKFADLFQKNQLPEYEDIEKYFAPSGSFAYDEATGLHMGSFTLRSDNE